MESLVNKYIDETGLLPRFYTGLLSDRSLTYTPNFIGWLKRRIIMFSEEFPSVREAQTKNILCCSGGNDSVALIQWAYENKLRNVIVLFNDTGWAIEWWADRMAGIKNLCARYGFRYSETKSIGFKDAVRMKKGFPPAAGPMQWCSGILKKEPTLKWLRENDPWHTAVIYIGIRRCESQNRANHPRSIIADTRYDGRPMEFPLVDYSDMDRDLIQEKTGIDILLHGSMECFPCANSKKSDLKLLAKYPRRVSELADFETEMGFTSKGKPRVMFRPYRMMGATGIKEAIQWALSGHGKYKRVIK